MQYQVTKRRLQVAGALAAIAVLLIGFHLDLFIDPHTGQMRDAGMGVSLLFLLTGCYMQTIAVQMRPVWNTIWMVASFFALPYLMVFLIEYLAGHDASLLPQYIFGLNFFWCQLVYVCVFALSNHYRVSMIVATVFCYLVGVANHFVTLFRGSPFQLSDILAVGTAADVAGTYPIALDYALLMTGSVAFFAVSLAILADYKQKRRTWKSATASLVLLCYVISGPIYFFSDGLWAKYDLKIDYWNPLLSYSKHGTALSLAMGAKSIVPEEPEDYTAAQVNAAVEMVLHETAQTPTISDGGMGVKLLNTSGSQVQYVKWDASKTTTTTESAVQMPNIIAIMNESFADMTILGKFATEVPIMNFYNSLNKNTIKGNLSVSTLGGGTCNTEFEFLTGLNMAFLPLGSMAYSQYTNHDMESMATILSSQGYTSIAFHPGKAESWGRDKVYPNLGFEAFYTAEDMEDPVYMRDAYITDSSNYQYVMQLFEEKEAGKPLFLFNVTIQNHGGYQLDTVGIPQWVALKGDMRQYNQAEQYFSLMHASDVALKELITYFQQVDEPTILVFFGDHQPNLETEFVETLLGKKLEALNMEEVQRRYTVPFFIWANYDIEERYYEQISANYLSTLAMEVAGAQLPEYNQYLSHLYHTLPVVNSLGYGDHDGQWHYFREENELTPYINGYEMVQYDYLFGKKNRVNGLYQLEGLQ